MSSFDGLGDGVMLFEGFGEFQYMPVELRGIDSSLMGMALDVLSKVVVTSR